MTYKIFVPNVGSMDGAVTEKELLQGCVELFRYLVERYEEVLRDEETLRNKKVVGWSLKTAIAVRMHPTWALDSMRKKARHEHIMISGEQLIALEIDHLIDDLMQRHLIAQSEPL